MTRARPSGGARSMFARAIPALCLALASCNPSGQAPGAYQPPEPATPVVRALPPTIGPDFLRVDYECENVDLLFVSISSQDTIGGNDQVNVATLNKPAGGGHAFVARELLPAADYLYVHLSATTGGYPKKSAYAHFGFDLDGSSGLPRPGPETKAAVAPAYWGRWVDLSTNAQWYLGGSSARRYPYPWSESAADREKYEVWLADDSAPSSSPAFLFYYNRMISDSNRVTLSTRAADLIELADADGQRHLLRRTGGRDLILSGLSQTSVGVSDGARGLSWGRSLGPAAGISLVIQNALNALDTQTVTTDGDSRFSVTVPSGQSDYLVTPLLGAAGQPVAKVEDAAYAPTLVRAETSGQDLGAVVSARGTAALKAAFAPNYWAGYNGSPVVMAGGDEPVLLNFSIRNAGQAGIEGGEYVAGAPPGTQVSAVGKYAPGYTGSGYGTLGAAAAFVLPALAPGEEAIVQLYASLPSSAISANAQDLYFPFSTNVAGWEDWVDRAAVRVHERRLLGMYYREFTTATDKQRHGTIISPFDILCPAWFGSLPLSDDPSKDYLLYIRASTDSWEYPFDYVIDLSGGVHEYSAYSSLVEHVVCGFDAPRAVYDGTVFFGRLEPGEEACFRIQASGDLDPLTLETVSGSLDGAISLGFRAGNAQKVEIVRTDLGTNLAEAPVRADNAGGLTTWTDPTALPGHLYKYAMRGFHEEKGYTHAVEQTASYSAYRVARNIAVPWDDARLLPDGPYRRAAADPARGRLWLSCPAGLYAVSIDTGLVAASYALPAGLTQDDLSEIELDTLGDPVLYARSKASCHRRSGGAWATTALEAASTTLGTDFAFDPAAGLYWVASTLAPELLGFDASGKAAGRIAVDASAAGDLGRIECDPATGSVFLAAKVPPLGGGAAAPRITRYDAAGLAAARAEVPVFSAVVALPDFMDLDRGSGRLVVLTSEYEDIVYELGTDLAVAATTDCTWDTELFPGLQSNGAARFGSALLSWRLQEDSDAAKTQVLLHDATAGRYKALAHRRSDALADLHPDGTGGLWAFRGPDAYRVDASLGLAGAFRAAKRVASYSGDGCGFIGLREEGTAVAPLAVLGRGSDYAEIATYSSAGWRGSAPLAKGRFALEGNYYDWDLGLAFRQAPGYVSSGNAVWRIEAGGTLGPVSRTAGFYDLRPSWAGLIAGAAWPSYAPGLRSPTLALYEASGSGIAQRGADLAADCGWLGSLASPLGAVLPPGSKAGSDPVYKHRLLGADAAGRFHVVYSGSLKAYRDEPYSTTVVATLPFAFVVRIGPSGRPDEWWGGYGTSQERAMAESAVAVEADGSVWSAPEGRLVKLSR